MLGERDQSGTINPERLLFTGTQEHVPMNTNSKQNTRRFLSVFTVGSCLILCFTACGCLAGGSDADTGAGSAGLNRSANWTEETHGNDVDPNYSVVFPEDEVNEITLTISPENWQAMLDEMTAEFGSFGGSSGSAGQGSIDYDPEYVSADITFDDTEWTDVGVRFKGQSTLGRTWTSGSYKISLKLDFDHYEDENPDIKNQRFYGFDELSLKSGIGDDSLLKDKVVPEIFNEVGVIAPDTAFYRVYVDYGDGPVYFGLYTMIESVEDTLIETAFEDDSGNVYKPEGTGTTFAVGTFTTEDFEKKTNEDEEDWSDVEALYTALNDDTRTTNPEEWRENLEEVFNVDGFVRWLAVNTVIQNWDTYGVQNKNFYLYTDPSDGTITWIPWDNNEALSSGREGGAFEQGMRGMDDDQIPGMAVNGTMMQPPEWSGDQNAMERPDTGFTRPEQDGYGNTTMMTFPDNGEMTGPFADGTFGGGAAMGGAGMGSPLSLSLDEVSDSWPLIRYLMDDLVYHAMYLEDLEEVATTVFSPERMADIYETNHNLIEPYVTGDEGETDGYTNLSSPEAFDASLDELIEHVNSRYDAVMEYLSTQTEV